MDTEFSFQWENISVTVAEKQYSIFKATEKRKHILNNISGCGNSNSLIAILGPSGCGKTTLLGAISGRIKEKTGVLKYNGRIIKNKEICNTSGYIQQEDMFTESLTVYEHMKFMTALKLHKTRVERELKIKRLLTELSLEEKKHTFVRLLSGGERRRLSLATELINNPCILFCDEPTTGLDSYSAMSVIQKLESIATSGKLVFVTLHQPSSQLFSLFDNIILLANGKLVFEGSRQQAKLFFESASLYCPASFNPADFYIKCLTINPGKEAEDEEKINNLSQLFCNKYLQKTNNAKEMYCLNHHIEDKILKRNIIFQLSWLMWRVYIDSKRNFQRFWANYTLLMVTALIISVAFSNVKLERPSSVQNIQGVLLLMVSELIFTHMYYVIYIFPAELCIFLREKSLYSPFPYYLSKLLFLVPICLINSASFLTIYSIILEFMRDFDLFFSILSIQFTISLCGICMGLCLSAIFSTVEYAHLFIVPFELVVMIVSGIWINVNSLPKIFSALKYLSPFYFGFRSTSTLFWQKVDHSANCTSQSFLPCYENGQEVLKFYGFFEEYDFVMYSILYMFVLTLIYCFIGYLGILRKRATHDMY